MGSLHGAPSTPWALGQGWFLSPEMGTVEGSLLATPQKGGSSSDTPDKTILYGPISHCPEVLLYSGKRDLISPSYQWALEETEKHEKPCADT